MQRSIYHILSTCNLGRGLRKLKNLPEPEPIVPEPPETVIEEKDDKDDTVDDSDKVPEDNEMVVEEDHNTEEKNELVVKNEENNTSSVGPTPTPTESVRNAFAEPEDGEEIEETNTNTVKMEE